MTFNRKIHLYIGVQTKHHNKFYTRENNIGITKASNALFHKQQLMSNTYFVLSQAFEICYLRCTEEFICDQQKNTTLYFLSCLANVIFYFLE